MVNKTTKVVFYLPIQNLNLPVSQGMIGITHHKYYPRELKSLALEAAHKERIPVGDDGRRDAVKFNHIASENLNKLRHCEIRPQG